MKYVLTNAEMREADESTIGRGVPSLTLMERAGLALAERAEKTAKRGEILCLCGGGNNGGDGFVCARILRERGREVALVCHAEKRSPDCAAVEKKWIDGGGKTLLEIPDEEFSLAVDCLYGTGFHGRLSGKDERAVLALNERKASGMKILSADIPSGVNGDNGLADGVAVRADCTLCIGELKRGTLFNDGMDYAGKIYRADIGIQLPRADYPLLTDGRTAKSLLPRRKRNSHKGSYGRAAIVGGSTEYTGAAYLSIAASLRSGVGYTTAFLPKEILPHYILKAPEALLRSCCEGGRYAFNEEKMKELLAYDGVAFGMGTGTSKEVFEGAKWLIENYEGKLLLDADGLNSLAAYGDMKEIFARKKGEILLTPHVKEFSRLSGRSVPEIIKESVPLAKAFAKEHGVTVLLKNALTVVTDGERVALNAAGSSGQAKGGSGDVLAGFIVGLCASGTSVFDGGRLGAYIVGYGAELAERALGARSLTASELVDYASQALRLTDLGISEDADEYGDAE